MRKLPKLFMRPATNPIEVQKRRRLLDRFIALRQEIEIDFNTVAHWNENVRKPNKATIDYDPTGELRQWCNDVDELIKSEAH